MFSEEAGELLRITTKCSFFTWNITPSHTPSHFVALVVII